MCRDLRKSDLPVASMQQQTPLQTGMRTGRSAAQAEEDPRFPVDLCLLSGSFQSKVSLLSSLGWITSWQLLWWPCNPLVCTCTSNQRGCPCVRAWHLERVPVSPTGGNRMVGKKLQPSAAPLGSAQLRSVKPKIIHNLSYETEEEGETEGEEVMTERCGAPRTRQHGQTVISLSSQLQDTPHTVQPLKLFSSFLPALGSFAPSLFPRRSQAVGLVNPGRLIALCISPQENGTDLQTDRKKRQKSLIDGENEDEEMRSWRERGRERKREKRTTGTAVSGETKRRWWDERGGGRREAAESGPVYANPPRAASKSGREAATAEEWAAFSLSNVLTLFSLLSLQM